MEVGILTFSRVHNYGAILQCYALYESLKNLLKVYNIAVNNLDMHRNRKKQT